MRPDGRGSEGQSRRRHSAMRASRQDGSGHDKVRYGVIVGGIATSGVAIASPK
jgi:hypothetical protein